MAKYFKKICCVILIMQVLIISWVTLIHADSRKEYYISKYNIIANIGTDGSAEIEEQITYKFTGNFNGVIMDIDYSGSSGIKDNSVFVIRNDNIVEVKPDNSQKQGTYLSSTEGTIYKMKIFEPSKDEEKTFIYRYKLMDVVLGYSDTAEFNRKLIGSKWDVRLENVNIKITLPEGAAKEDIKVFAHGPLTGQSFILDSRNVELKAPLVPPQTFVEARVLFPVNIVTNLRNVVQKKALDDILRQEAGFAEEANKQRQQARQSIAREQFINKILNAIFILMILCWFILIAWIYKKFDKEFKSSFNAKYYRELPGEYTPAEMSVLVNFGKVNPRDIMATLLDLVRKQQIVIKETSVLKKVVFWDKKKTDYCISLNENPPEVLLKPHEKYLIDWFINEIGDGRTVLLGQIREYANDKSKALNFKKYYDNWMDKVIIASEQNDFFQESNMKGMIIGILTATFYIVAGILAMSRLTSILSACVILQGIVLFIYTITIKKRSLYGNEQYKMWLAFKRFLKDFSRLNEATVPSIVLWEHYLVYAVSLGIATDVIKQLPLVLREDDFNNRDATFMYGMLYGSNIGHVNSFNNMFNETMNTVQNAVTSSKSIAASVNSSASGSGGGFSRGNSGGGGGGSGGGAF